MEQHALNSPNLIVHSQCAAKLQARHSLGPESRGDKLAPTPPLQDEDEDIQEKMRRATT
jgi:hypothetical protein